MSDHLHRETCGGRANNAANTPYKREGRVTGNQGLARETLAELDQR